MSSPPRSNRPSRIAGLREALAGNKRWIMVGLLFCLSTVNYLDRQTLSILAPTLREKLSFGPEEYSYIVIAFLVAYALGYSFCGQILDRFGAKRVLALALAAWSVTSLLHGLAAGWIGLAVCRFLLGLGESFGSPGGVKAITEWMPPRERATSMAIFSTGNVFGMMIAPPLVALIAVRFGWRWAFVVTSAMGFAILAIWLKYYHSPQSHPSLSTAERAYLESEKSKLPAAQPKTPFLKILRHPVCLAFFFSRFLTDSISFFFSFWLPDYYANDMGLSLVWIGLVGWFPYLASDLGALGGGTSSDALIRRGWHPRRARFTLMTVAACLMPLSCVAVRVENTFLSIAMIAMLLASQSCWMVNQLSLISESVAPQNVASMLSISALGGSLGGILFNLMAGRIISDFGYVPIFSTIGFLHAAALILLYAAHRWRGSAAMYPQF